MIEKLRFGSGAMRPNLECLLFDRGKTKFTASDWLALGRFTNLFDNELRCLGVPTTSRRHGGSRLSSPSRTPRLLASLVRLDPEVCLQTSPYYLFHLTQRFCRRLWPNSAAATTGESNVWKREPYS